MKVRLTIDVDEADRYLVATYYREHGGADKPRRRATRRQVRAYVASAFRLALRDRRDAINGRTRSTAQRIAEKIANPNIETAAVLEFPHERTPNLFR